MLIINKVNIKVIEVMLKENYNTLTSTMDDMYEQGIIPLCDFFEIIDNDELCGYFATNNENVLLQFYIKNRNISEITKILTQVIDRNKIKKCLCCTNDPTFYSLAKKLSINISIHDYMFIEDEVINNPVPFDGIKLMQASSQEFEEVLTYFTSVDIKGDWLKPYIKQRIELGELFLFRFQGKIIASGESRVSLSSPTYANIGMSVASEYRRRRLGSYIVSELRRISNENNHKAICSTSVDNVASYNTIIHSGFRQYHTIDEITLSK